MSRSTELSSMRDAASGSLRSELFRVADQVLAERMEAWAQDIRDFGTIETERLDRDIRDDLGKLEREAKHCARAVLQDLAYGRALHQLRDALADDAKFRDCVATHGLDLEHCARAMWYAEQLTRGQHDAPTRRCSRASWWSVGHASNRRNKDARRLLEPHQPLEGIGRDLGRGRRFAANAR